ncbi:MAG: radical SAM protein [Thermoprotei archaeon]|nr:MAG: radical SAM protein [Thermoprotei archaeon]
MSGSIAFGPVPSRRLGRSLGVNNLPEKVCTYSCVYCQAGRTRVLTTRRRRFYDPERVLSEVRARLESVAERGERVDYVTFVPNGEPTLDINLGDEIRMVRGLGIPVAVLTNASLLWDEGVRADLAEADLVSVKVDAVSEGVWRRVNRPHPSLRLLKVLEGLLEFAREYSGTLITETMLISGIDYGREVKELAEFVAELDPHRAYVAIPTRPPCEEWVRPASEATINAVFQELSRRLGDRVELLTQFEGTEFGYTGDAERDLLSVTAVHPLREDAVEELLRRDGADWGLVERLVREGLVAEVEYGGHRYYLRRVSR